MSPQSQVLPLDLPDGYRTSVLYHPPSAMGEPRGMGILPMRLAGLPPRGVSPAETEKRGAETATRHKGGTPVPHTGEAEDANQEIGVPRDPMTPAPLPVLFVHGIQSHPDWFTGSADMLAARGHPVYQVMRRGSGTNTVARGDARSPGQLMDDLDAACAFVLRHAAEQGLAVCNPGALHVVGISWGGKLVAAWAASRRRAYAASLTLVAPGIISRVDLPPAIKLRIAWALLAHPRRLFDIPLNDLSLFTDNPARRDYLSRDPHRLHRATARFLFASRRLEAMLIRAKAGSLNIPTTLILARQDRIIDNGRTRRIVEHLTAGRAMVHVLDGCHTLEFEADPTAFHECLRIGIRE